MHIAMVSFSLARLFYHSLVHFCHISEYSLKQIDTKMQLLYLYLENRNVFCSILNKVFINAKLFKNSVPIGNTDAVVDAQTNDCSTSRRAISIG